MNTVQQTENHVLRPIIVIGSGGHATVLLDLLRLLGRRVLFLTDRDESRHGQEINLAQVRGFDEIILDYSPDEVRLVNGIGSIGAPTARREIYQRFSSAGYVFETLVHPSAVMSHNVFLEEGVQVMAGVVIQPGVCIGKNALINTRASVDHDCRIGPHVHLAPGVTLSGQVRVSESAHIGTGATIIQGIQVGCEAVVGAGAVVVRDVPGGERVVGIPARPMKNLSGKRQCVGELFTVLLAAAGRRASLLKLIRQSAAELGLNPCILATDITRNSAAFHLGDVSRRVPSYGDPRCLDEMLALCREFQVRLIVPTIDPDLPFLAEHRRAFEESGATVMVSSSQTIGICNDKKLTHAWLAKEGFPVLRQTDVAQLLENQETWKFPLFIKPRGGSSSVGARVVQSLEDLRYATRDGEYIAQEIARGQEYTVDLFVDKQGRCRCAVPRLRMETRGGEVTKAMTVRCPPVEDTACRVAEALPGAAGVLNIQIFFDGQSGEIAVSEINPRFGGGYPLTHQAGAPMIRWLIEETLGLPCTARDDGWQSGLVMLRYDEAVFVDHHQAGVELPAGSTP